MKMLIKVCLLLLSLGVYASYAVRSAGSKTEDPLFGELDFIFPQNFVSRFPENSEFFTTKILVYLLFNLFAKYLGEHEPVKFWSKFNQNDFNRVAIDATFYEYLTKFVDGKRKHLVFDPLKSSTNPEDVAIHRIGDYLDNIASAHVFSDQSAVKYFKRNNMKCAYASGQGPAFGMPGRDFPNYCDIPQTSFTCENLVPGTYADIETGCQVFHSCWPRRIDSFLCPIGTTFNQDLLTCDFWQNSDCLSSPLFDRSEFAKGETSEDVETTVVIENETPTTSESPSTFASELDIPEYDGTCQSLFTEPMQRHMMLPPAKCKVADLKPSTPKPAGESSELARILADLLGGDLREIITSIYKRAELGSRMHGVAKMPEMKVKRHIPKSDSNVLEATDSQLQNDVDTTSEEQIYPSTTELPYDNKDVVIEESVIKGTSPGKVTYTRTVTKSTLLKPSKPSEDAIKQVFNSMITSLDLGSRIINEGLLPLVEKIVLDNHRKKSKS